MTFRPIFIAGCDRSGTTLLGDMLGNTPHAITTPESQFMHDLVIQMQLGAFETSLQAAEWLQQHFRFAVWNLQLETAQLADLIDLEAPRKTLENIITRYARNAHPDKPAAAIWVDHTPDNFKYYAVLKGLFPDARFIHIVRDGRAVCASIRHLDWGPNNAYSASRHWAERLQQALSVEVAEKDNCLRVRFEDLLRDPREVMQQVSDFARMDMQPSMLQGGGLVVPGFTKGQHRLVGKPPEASRIDSWRSKLSDKDLKDFESYPLSHLLLEKLGYTPDHEQPPVLSSRRVLGRYCHEFASYLRNRFRHVRMETSVVDKQASDANQQDSADRDAHSGSLSNQPAS